MRPWVACRGLPSDVREVCSQAGAVVAPTLKTYASSICLAEEGKEATSIQQAHNSTDRTMPNMQDTRQYFQAVSYVEVDNTGLKGSASGTGSGPLLEHPGIPRSPPVTHTRLLSPLVTETLKTTPTSTSSSPSSFS